MPRIRSIKPEFWTSGQVLECSTNARLLFIGLWNFCDDKGRHPFRPKQMKAEVFPADGFDENDILGMVRELSENGLVTLYEHDSQRFLQVRGWHHQRIDKPQDPKYPDPFDEHSKIIRGTLPPDRKGCDGIEDSPSGECESPGGESPEDPPADESPRKQDRTPYQEIIDLYRSCCPSLPDVVKLTPARRQAIRARCRNELPTLDDWEQFFKVVQMSDFLTGRVEPSGGRSKPFVADIDFLTKQGNCVKVMEGKYDD